MPSGQILIVSADARWLRVLEVTVRLGGATTASRHSVGEVRRALATDADRPTAMIVDLSSQASPAELDDVRGLVRDHSVPAVVILPERLAGERSRLEGDGARVLIRPYRPSELYAALWPGERSAAPAMPPALAADEPLSVALDEGPALR